MKPLILKHYNVIFALLVGLLIILSFYGGILYGKQGTSNPITLSCSEEVLSTLKIPPAATESVKAQEMVSSGKYVGSKNGTKYYLPSCSSAKRIKPENYHWFQTAEEAQLQGYTLGSC